MQYSYAILALAAIATGANAVTIADIPACAQTCILTAISSATTCGASDITCQCTTANQAAITSAATPCVLGACTDPADISKTLSVTAALCSQLTASSSVAPSTSAVSSSPVAVSSSTTPVVVSTSSTPVGVSTSSSSSTPVVVSTTSAIVTSTTAKTNSTATTTAAIFTGAAVSNAVAGLGSVFALGVAALAAF